MKVNKLNPALFKANNLRAFLSLIPTLVLAAVGYLLALSDLVFYYFLGELILSFVFFQTFILLHECAHLNFFKTRSLNIVFGHLFGFFSFIPFYTWQQIHNLHHRWTGWRDKDPTTEITIAPSSSKLKNLIVNLAWKLFIPLFYLSYKISNYWNLAKIKRFINAAKFKKAVIQVSCYTMLYILLIVFFGKFISSYVLPAFLLSLVWKELVIMSQHSHVEMHIANDHDVKPFSFADQVQYTRSFYLNAFIAKYLLFNFNLHEAHHAHPGIPAYELDKVDLGTQKSPKALEWLVKAKSMNGVDYVFKTSKDTGEKF